MELTREQLEQQLEHFKDPVLMIDFLNYYADEFSQTDHEYAEKLAGRSLTLARSSGYDKGLARALVILAVLEGYHYNYDAMYDYVIEAEVIVQNLPDKEKSGFHRIYSCKGVYFFDRGNYSKASHFFNEAIVLCRQTGDLDKLGSYICNLSTIYAQLGQYEKALESSEAALELLERGTSNQSLIYTFNNTAYYCNYLGFYSRAEVYLKKAINLAWHNQLFLTLPMIMVTLVETYQHIKDYYKADILARKAVELSRKDNNFREEITSLLRLGDLYTEIERLEEAEEALTLALTYMDKHQMYHQEIEIHDTLVTLYRKKEDCHKTLYHQERYFELKKKHLDQEMNSRMQNLESDSLREANRRIKIISALGREITSSLDMKKVALDVYKSFKTLMEISIFGILLYNKEQENLVSEVYIEDGEYIDPITVSIDNPSSLSALVIREERDIIIQDFETEFKKYLPGVKKFEECLIKTKQSAKPLSILCSPLRIGNEVTGVLVTASFKKNAYTISDLDALKALASYVAIGFKNAGQARVIREQNRRLSLANQQFKDDLKLSRELQLAMIPFDFPESPLYKIYGYFFFLDDVGGDLYDVYTISPDKTVVLILDVVGHGVSAALVTAMAKILFFNKSRLDLSASDIVEAVNREITPITGGSFTYFSLFFGIIDTKEHTLEYVNAAHPAPLLIKEQGSVDYLSSTSLFVGLKKEYPYEQKKVSLGKSDRLVLYTDGFFEMKGKNKKRFGEERLIDILIHNRTLNPEQVLKKINKELEQFQIEEVDDRTMLIIDFL